MEIRPHRIIERRKQRKSVENGDKSPISVQSMTNTLTTDVKKTINQ